MVGLFVSVVHFFVISNALLRSVRERFALGVAGAVVRVLLIGVSAVYGFKVSFAGSAGPEAGPAFLLLASAVLGPIVSFFVLYRAHRRMRAIPAVEVEREERASRVFAAWLGVGIIDAMSVVLAILIRSMSGP